MAFGARSVPPTLIALVAALFWGVWWIPIRMLEGFGLPGAWAGVSMNLGAIVILLVVVLLGARSERLSGFAIVGAALAGAAVTLYSTALTQTDVARTVLLFYLAPAWSIALECVFAGRRFRLINGLAFLFAFAGIVLIFRGDVSLSGWGVGDAMALASGMCWAVGAAMIFWRPGFSVAKLSLAAFVSAAALGAGLALLLGQGDPASMLSARTALAALLSGGLYVTPVFLATLWSASRLPPATMSFLLTAEIVTGVGSSAILLDEPFGAPEALGAVFVALAATIEVFAPGKPQKAL